MLQHQLKLKFISHLETKYPALRDKNLQELISDNLLSPFTVPLPKILLEQITESVKAFAELRANTSYQNYILENTPELHGYKAPNQAICNSLDFHVTEDGQLKLVEINTNAAFLALGIELYQCQKNSVTSDEKAENPNVASNVTSEAAGKDANDVISKMVSSELSYFKNLENGKHIAIVDDEPQNQRLYCEFLVYQEYFRSHGFECEILDLSQVASTKADFIYNRNTDFFLTEERSKAMKEKYINEISCVSPNPWEYALLADKTRFINWTDGKLLEKLTGLSAKSSQQISKILPYTYTVTERAKDEVWADRKKLFFKPKRSFGSKQTLKGFSIARKAFEEIYSSDFVAQELISPAEMSFKSGAETSKMKFDLRCYFYKDQLQLVIARIYQGQVTNLRTPNGGFACVEFI